MVFLPFIILVVGAAVTWYTRNRPARVGWIISSITAILAWLTSLTLITAIPRIAGVSVWRPQSLFQSQIELQLDFLSWPFVYASATLLLANILTHPARTERVLPGRQAILLVFTSFHMVAMLSDNILTIATTWALMDILSVVMIIVLLKRETDIQQIISRLAIDGASLLLILIAAVANIRQTGDSSLANTSISPATVLFLSSAVLLKLGFLHLRADLTHHPQLRDDVGIMINLLPAGVALAMLSRLMALGVPENVLPWLSITGLIALAIGGLRWAFETDGVRHQSALILGISGLGIFVASSLGGDANVIVAAGTLMILVGSVIFSIEIFSPPHRIWPGICGLLIAGCPGTPGGFLLTRLFPQPFNMQALPNIALTAAGLVLLSVGTIRYFNLQSTRWRSAESLVRFVYGLGLSLPVLVAFGLGLWMADSLAMPALVGFVVVFGLTITVILAMRRVPYRNLARWARLLAWIDPKPIYGFFTHFGRGVLAIIRSTGDILEGEGAMLWLIVILLLVNLGVRGMG